MNKFKFFSGIFIGGYGMRVIDRVRSSSSSGEKDYDVGTK